MKTIFEAFFKVKKVILSCKTLDQISVANNLIENFKKLYPTITADQYFNLRKYLKKRAEVIKRYGKCLEGSRVVSITNQNEDSLVGTVIQFTDCGKEHQSYIPLVRFYNEPEKDCFCMGILIPYESEQQVKELNGLTGNERWNKYCNSYHLL